MPNSPKKAQWKYPNEVMQLQKLRKKKKALQARISSSAVNPISLSDNIQYNQSVSNKRKNPFQTYEESKKIKCDTTFNEPDESSDQTLFKLIHLSADIKNFGKENLTSFKNTINPIENVQDVEIVKADGEFWIPIDWALKTKVKFLSQKPFPFNQKFKISEEASGITSFARCLDITNSTTSLDASIKSKFYQCCLYWQQPYMPWHSLFPRKTGKSSSGQSIATNATIKDGLHNAYTNSLRSLFQLIRTKQCPYFYLCANNFTVLFRAAGICGFSEIHALITPTTRGFRQMLKQKEIEFTMPLKKGRCSGNSDSLNSSKNEDADDAQEDEDADEEWLESMGINREDIKQINYTQERIKHKAECAPDNNEESLILIEGLEVQALYNFLINCKSAISPTGPNAGIPPTLLAPTAFHGATLNSLKIRESKAHLDNEDFYALELMGPLLPQVVHNLCDIFPKEHSYTATFANLLMTIPFSKVLSKSDVSKNESKTTTGSAVFSQENLSDCGFKPNILKHFCSDENNYVVNIECLKYTSETKSYSWT